ncbi:BLUF domain-containing protein [Pseudoxanthomonas sp. PXM02]|nr:BLUF domain-containing protein [Pseudoxanthomonas sp. PXM02]
MSSKLSALAYVSRATEQLDSTRLRSLLTDAIEFNGKHDLSGALVFDGSCFFQYIEGPRGSLSEAVSRIRASRSHLVLLHLMDGPVAARRFEGWEMFYRDGAASGIEGLNWLPGREPQGDLKRDLVANSLSYFWRNFDKDVSPARHI